ncbi:MAG: hypothetical protein NTZ74_13070 [Chloroflexi bacterium]|nr:hypothetical protein [Chloroflexota bacterium]
MIQIKKMTYGGWPNCYSISNGQIELIATTDVGPRIIFFGFLHGENQFYEKLDESGKTGGQEWRIYGGHRLWHAPEDPKRTYVPDNYPVEITQLEGGVRLTAPIESNGVQKVIEIHLSDTAAQARVNHILINHGAWAIPVSPWGLSVMRAGGMAIIPHTERSSHTQSLNSTHSLTLWGYTLMNDPRWTWGGRYIYLKQDESISSPQKLGILNTQGWAAYLRKGCLFLKNFSYVPGAAYPDINSNFEIFTNHLFMELESLGPLTQLEPGGKTEHWEEWRLFNGISTPSSEDEVEKLIFALLESSPGNPA